MAKKAQQKKRKEQLVDELLTDYDGRNCFGVRTPFRNQNGGKNDYGR